jgi:hypothetical protein
MEAYMISWKIYMIIEFCFDIVDLLKQMKNISIFQRYVKLIVANNVEQ